MRLSDSLPFEGIWNTAQWSAAVARLVQGQFSVFTKDWHKTKESLGAFEWEIVDLYKYPWERWRTSEAQENVNYKICINLVPYSHNETKLDALISQIYFWNKTLHVSDSSSVHHQQFFTVHTAVVYVIQIASCQQTCMTYTIAVCTVKNSWWWTEELSETCRVLFQK